MSTETRAHPTLSIRALDARGICSETAEYVAEACARPKSPARPAVSGGGSVKEISP